MRGHIRKKVQTVVGSRCSFSVLRGCPSLLAILALSFLVTQARAEDATPLPTITNFRAIHLMTANQARRAYPVHAIGVVTYFDIYLNRPRRPLLMVTDSTATIYVKLNESMNPPLKAGTLVEVTGQTNPGEFAPIVSHADVKVLAQNTPLPPAPKETLSHMRTGTADAQWCQIEGIVQSVQESEYNVTLKLALPDGETAATTVKEPGANYRALIDARVRVRGVVGTLFNRHRQLFGAQLFFPNISMVEVLQPPPPDPFQLPVTALGDLLRYEPGKLFNHRVHVRGTVTLLWPGRLICLQQETQSLCADTTQTSILAVGSRAEVIGFPHIGAVTPTLTDATYQPAPGPHVLTVAPITADDAFTGEHDAQLIQIEGTLIAHDKAAQDPTIVISSGKFTFPVILPNSSDSAALLALEDGSRLRITGICSLQTDRRVILRHDGFPVAKYFQIMLRSSSDVVVLQTPSWWSAKHLLYVLGFALAITLLVLCWVVILRNRVKEQTKLLRHQATHDGLTGIWNRKAVLDLLQREFEIAARAHSSVGVLMLDADHFKRVNDTYGHPAGDTVLKELANRIQKSVRSFDVIGRYGGEEFLVVIPGCTAEQARQCAERIRSTVAESPVDANGSALAVTVSVGTAVLNPLINTQNEALAAADSALYRAKHAGRNRVVCCDLSSELMTAMR